MKTTHRALFADARRMDAVSPESVSLVVTSPPYPMIEMWDDMFCDQEQTIRDALKRGDGAEAFELMHRCLDPVWSEAYRVLREGGIACINIGDATRTIDKDFRLYSNHTRITHDLLSLGFSAMPNILWRKQTNAPNKFMGSGMLPAGAYVTLEHEYILIVRKGGKREFKDENAKANRRASAFFWEERNAWFSDVWMDVKGTRQELGDRDTRSRSAAFPFEVAYRLVNMFSAKGDTVLDPFLGTGTTMLAAMVAGRDSIGFEIDPKMGETIRAVTDVAVESGNKCIEDRLTRHVEFAAERLASGRAMKHTNAPYGFPVVTAQETGIVLNRLEGAAETGEDTFEVSYTDGPQEEFCRDWANELMGGRPDRGPEGGSLSPNHAKDSKPAQPELF